MPELSQLLLYIPGAVIFLVGSGQTRSWLRSLRGKGRTDGVILSSEHVQKKDAKERDVFNFYNVTVEYVEPETHHTVRQAFKSQTDYALGQPVYVYRDARGRTAVTEKVDESVFHPILLMIGGALLILLALWQNQGNQAAAMGCLAAVLAGAGVAFIWNYIKLKKMGLLPVEGEIIEVFKRQISKESKILKGNRFTYYPIVRYELNGKENIRRCLINSSGEKSFKVGEPMMLYYDEKTGAVREKNAKIAVLIAGIVLLAIGLLAGLSILSVLI